jgi:hypothetical protein
MASGIAAFADAAAAERRRIDLGGELVPFDGLR